MKQGLKAPKGKCSELARELAEAHTFSIGPRILQNPAIPQARGKKDKQAVTRLLLTCAHLPESVLISGCLGTSG